MTTRKPIEIAARRATNGHWEVVTAFLGNTVGSSLGACTGLTEAQAKTLADRWRVFQGQEAKELTDFQWEKIKPKKNFKGWDSHPTIPEVPTR